MLLRVEAQMGVDRGRGRGEGWHCWRRDHAAGMMSEWIMPALRYCGNSGVVPFSVHDGRVSKRLRGQARWGAVRPGGAAGALALCPFSRIWQLVSDCCSTMPVLLPLPLQHGAPRE